MHFKVLNIYQSWGLCCAGFIIFSSPFAAVSEEELHFAMEQGDDLPLPSKFQTNDDSCDTNGLHNSNNNSTEETSTREEEETLENATVIESREEHLKPERSDCMPSFGANFMEKQRQKLQQETLKISWEETK